MFNKYFVAFHKILSNYVNISNSSLYSKLFSWAYDDDNTDLSDSQVSKWIYGTAGVPEKIRMHAVNSSDAALGEYEMVFHGFLEDKNGRGEKTSIVAEKMLEIDMENYLAQFPVPLPLCSKKALNVSKAFVTSLVYDGLASNEKYVDVRLRSKINTCISECQKKNISFHTPYILDILMKEPQTLLSKMLDEISPDVKGNFRDKLDMYLNNQRHNPFKSISLNELELVQIAKLLNYIGRQEDRSLSFIAGEHEFCRAIVRCKNSNSINALKPLLGNAANADRWDHLAEKCASCGGTTTSIM